MVLSFGELGIQLHEFNGMILADVRKAIINIAADAITLARYAHPATAVETLYDWENADVNFSRWRVTINPIPSNAWCAINMWQAYPRGYIRPAYPRGYTLGGYETAYPPQYMRHILTAYHGVFTAKIWVPKSREA